ncbi:unnamed protein product [Periconia digitata]|uniref:Uncharacterized protein n=1 Tax=Periconia digitata TaxID=1303443 RepID=A0A9W4UUN3_9PLEO|nr:unnamed protein product [Periconia digitata]
MLTSHIITFVVPFLIQASPALPQATPVLTSIPADNWASKVSALRTYILSQPPSLTNAGFSKGPTYQLTFSDGDCHQIRLYNWDCSKSIPYSMRGIANWIDDSDFASYNLTRFEDWRFFVYGWYRDPDDGFAFYDVARMTWGPCGNRGPQSACGHVYCTDKNGVAVGGPGTVPEGENPWLDPNERDRTCEWLKE